MIKIQSYGELTQMITSYLIIMTLKKSYNNCNEWPKYTDGLFPRSQKNKIEDLQQN